MSSMENGEKHPKITVVCLHCKNNIMKMSGKNMVHWCKRYAWNLDKLMAVDASAPGTCHER